MDLASRIALKLAGGLAVDDPTLDVGLVSYDASGAASFEVRSDRKWVTVTVTPQDVA